MENEKQSLKFNMAMPYLIRVDILLSKVSECAIKEDYRMMKQSLRALYRELSPYVSSGDKQILERHFKVINNHEKARYKFELMGGADNFNNDLTSKQIQKRFNYHNNFAKKLLDKLSIRLMEQVHKLGLLIPNSTDRTFIGGGD